jgi:GNAT superfamily N-acetyltransferase
MEFDLRPAAPADATGIAEIWRTVEPHIVKTARQIENELRESTVRRMVVATDGAQLVGYGSTWLPPATDPERPSRITVLVPADFRRAGVGSRLVAATTEVAAGTRARSILTVVGDGSRAFAERHGFTIGRRLSHSRAVLADIPPAPPVPAGLELAGFDELPDPRAVWEASAAVAEHDPSGLSEIPVYEEWLATEWSAPDHALDLSVAVLDGDRVAAFVSTAADRERGAVWSNLTGTVPAYRGRGLAKLVKAVALARCRDAGLTEALTGNDADNRPMLAVNEWLGYRVAGFQWTATKALRS